MPTDVIGAAHGVQQPRANHLQQGVTGAAADAAIERAEVVEVDDEQAQAMLLRVAPCERRHGLRAQRPSIRQSGQGIAADPFACLLFTRAALRQRLARGAQGLSRLSQRALCSGAALFAGAQRGA